MALHRQRGRSREIGRRPWQNEPLRERRFTPCLFSRVKLVGNKSTPALLVRDAAIGTDQDRKFVLVVGPGDSLVYRPVELGRLQLSTDKGGGAAPVLTLPLGGGR